MQLKKIEKTTSNNYCFWLSSKTLKNDFFPGLPGRHAEHPCPAVLDLPGNPGVWLRAWVPPGVEAAGEGLGQTATGQARRHGEAGQAQGLSFILYYTTVFIINYSFTLL